MQNFQQKDRLQNLIQLKKCFRQQTKVQTYLEKLSDIDKSSIIKYSNLRFKQSFPQQPFSIESLYSIWDQYYNNPYKCIEAVQHTLQTLQRNFENMGNIGFIWYNYAVFLFKLKYYNSSITYAKKSLIPEAKNLERMIKMAIHSENQQILQKPSNNIELDNIKLIESNNLSFCSRLIQIYNNKKIPIRIAYNFALVFKKNSNFTPALQIFQSICNKSKDNKLNLMIKINIAELQSELKNYYRSLKTYKDILQTFNLTGQCQLIIFKRLKQLKTKIQTNKIENQILKKGLVCKPLKEITNQLSELNKLSIKQQKLQNMQRIFQDSLNLSKFNKSIKYNIHHTNTIYNLNSTSAIPKKKIDTLKKTRCTQKLNEVNLINSKIKNTLNIENHHQRKTIKIQRQKTQVVQPISNRIKLNLKNDPKPQKNYQQLISTNCKSLKVPPRQSLNMLSLQKYQVPIASTNSITYSSSNLAIYDHELQQILEDYDESLAEIRKTISNKNYQYALQQIQSQLHKPGAPSFHKIQCLKLKINFYLQLEQYEKVIQLYNQLIYSLKADNPKNYVKLAQVYLKNQDEKTAIKTFLIAASKGQLQAYERIAQLFYGRGQFYQAIRYYEKKLAKTEDNECKIKLAHLYGKVPHFHTKGIQILKFILQQDPHNELAAITLGNIYEKQKQFSKCIEIYQNFRINNMMSININYLLGLVYKEMNNQIKSFQSFVQALRINPVHIPSLIEISRYIYPNSMVQSFRLLKSALHVEPNNLQIMRLLYKLLNSSKNEQSPKKKLVPKAKKTLKQQLRQIGDCFYKNQFISQAEIVYQYIVKEYDTWQELEKIADICTIKGDYKEAQRIYIKLKKRYPIQKFQIFYKLAKIKYITQKYNQAIEYANLSFQIKENKTTLQLIALCYEATNQIEKAKAFYNAMTIKYEDDLQLMKRIKARLAFCQNVLGDYSHQKQTYLSLIQADEYNFTALHNLAHIFLAQGDYQQYFVYIQQLLQLYPNQTKLRKKLIKVAMQENQYQKARFHLQKCQQMYLKDQQIINLQKQLQEKYAYFILQSSTRKEKRKKTKFILPKVSDKLEQEDDIDSN